jgi:AraC family transcriptional regulator
MFGTLPSTVRQTGSIETLKLMEPIQMDKSKIVTVEPPRIKSMGQLSIVGIGLDCAFDTISDIPSVWQAFNSREDEVPNAKGQASYGVCTVAESSGRFRYIAGCASDVETGLPHGMERIVLPAGRYAVFTHKGHIAELPKTVFTIWNKSLSENALTVREAPNFELYDKRFDPKTGRGVVEVWIPIEA